MSEQDKTRAGKKKYNDIFITNSIYPEVNSIFKVNQTLEEIKGDCYIVLDTSILLLPYNTGKEGLSQIKKTYQKLISESRLIVPAQVAREFVKNRANKLIDLYQSLKKKKNNSVKEVTYPLLESLSEYQELIEIENIIEDKLKEYKKKIDKILDHIQNWSWNDPVSLMYAELFNDDVILSTDIDEEEIKKDLERRQEYEIPPGYEDAPKPDSGVGDLLIWHGVLEVGRKYKKSVIFVSGEKKGDWWHKKGSDALYPRYELVDEFRRASEGQSFHIIELSHLLQLYGASETAIKEIKQEEEIINISINNVTFGRDQVFFDTGRKKKKKLPKEQRAFLNLKGFLEQNIKIARNNLEIIDLAVAKSEFGLSHSLSYFDSQYSAEWIEMGADSRTELMSYLIDTIELLASNNASVIDLTKKARKLKLCNEDGKKGMEQDLVSTLKVLKDDFKHTLSLLSNILQGVKQQLLISEVFSDD